MKSSIELREQRAKVVSNARLIVDAAEADQRDLTAEELTQFDALMGQADTIDAEVASAERKEKLANAEAATKQSQGRTVQPARLSTRNELDRRTAGEFMRSWAIAGAPNHRPTADTLYRAADYGFDLGSQVINYRALSKGTTTAGGYTVPQSFSDQLEKLLAYFFPVGEVAEQFNTNDGRDYPWPTVDDTSNSAALVAEAGGVGSSTDPTFGQVTFKRFDYFSPIVKVSYQLLQDSDRDIPSLLAELFAERQGRAMETACVSTNAGSTAAEGMLHGVTAGVNLDTGNAITLAKLLALETSVPLAYRRLPGVSFLMHDATWQAIRAILDGTNRPLINPDVANGTEMKLLGYPVYLSNAMTSISSPGDNAPLILFGSLNKYKIRRISSEASLTRLNELYAGNGQVGFVQHEAWDARWITVNGVRTLNSFDAP